MFGGDHAVKLAGCVLVERLKGGDSVAGARGSCHRPSSWRRHGGALGTPWAPDSTAMASQQQSSFLLHALVLDPGLRRSDAVTVHRGCPVQSASHLQSGCLPWLLARACTQASRLHHHQHLLQLTCDNASTRQTGSAPPRPSLRLPPRALPPVSCANWTDLRVLGLFPASAFVSVAACTRRSRLRARSNRCAPMAACVPLQLAGVSGGSPRPASDRQGRPWRRRRPLCSAHQQLLAWQCAIPVAQTASDVPEAALGAPVPAACLGSA